MNRYRASRRVSGRLVRRVALGVLFGTLLAGLWAPVPGAAWQEWDLRVVVIGGQARFNIIDEGTLTPTVQEVRAGNYDPVPGAALALRLEEGGTATLNAGLQKVELTTNALERASVTEDPVSGGPVELLVAATFGGETATASVLQTNLETTVEGVPKVVSTAYGEDTTSGEPSGGREAEGRREYTRILLDQYGTGASRVFGGIEFVRIPPSGFAMGSTDSRAGADEGPVTRVRISRGFWLGKYEVTQTEWIAVMGPNPSGFAGCPLCPVERVSWKDVQEFIRRVNANETGNLYRLPTEAEWEYAARAGTAGDRYLENLDTIAWHRSNSTLRTRPVGQTEPNAFGLYDVLGNVWEWVQDWKADYPGGEVTDPRGPDVGSQRVYRGCSWISDAEGCRVSVRYADAPEYRFNHLGFRLVREIP